MSIKIILATGNSHKIIEVQEILGNEYEVVGLKDLPPMPEIVEDADSFEGNSAKKAVEVSKFFNCLALADDSGLEVDALNGAPGIHSARYCGEHGNDAGNNEKLLLQMQDHKNRKARFVCAASVAEKGKILKTFRGTLEGEILLLQQGSGGFGYDPLMYLPDLNKTVAQLSLSEKSKISHRKKAFEKLREFLLEIKFTL